MNKSRSKIVKGTLPKCSKIPGLVFRHGRGVARLGCITSSLYIIHKTCVCLSPFFFFRTVTEILDSNTIHSRALVDRGLWYLNVD